MTRSSIACCLAAGFTLLALSGAAPATPAADHVPATAPGADGAGKAEAGSATANAPQPPALRLPPGAKPLRYAVDLTLSPEAEDFAGSIDIDLALDAPITALWLNAAHIEATEATLSLAGETSRPRPVPGGKNFLGLLFERPVGPGSGVLHVAFRGKAPVKESMGIFRQKEKADWYLFTQFEELGARRAFPCFDEPSYKVPWQITLRIPEKLTAVSNTSVASETALGGGLKAVRFAQTRPLPSYLIAFAVGPFDFAEGPPLGTRRIPFRIVTPRGQGALAAFSLAATPPILARLEAYFGSAYPYDKLDFLAVPVFGGAMENPGLITFGRGLLLAKPADDTLRSRRRFTEIAAHELAHMWFGDLVTLKWWDDTWLNESFADWMADKVVEQLNPDWGVAVERVRGRERAMQRDSLISARRVHQPIESDDDIANAFDAITYSKGSAVLNMFETWVGAEPFRTGVQRYLAAHAWGSASAEDFFASFSSVAGTDLVPAFRSFVDQGGIPLVTATVLCDGTSAPRLRLTQKRYLPAGSLGSAQQTWQIPVCFRYAAGAEVHRQCALLKESSQEFPLASAGSCPDWLLPNEGAAGYFRARLGAGDTEDGPTAGSQDGSARVPEGAAARRTGGAANGPEAAQVTGGQNGHATDPDRGSARAPEGGAAGARASGAPTPSPRGANGDSPVASDGGTGDAARHADRAAGTMPRAPAQAGGEGRPAATPLSADEIEPAPASRLAHLFDQEREVLSLPERIGVLDDLSALADAGDVPAGEVLSLMPVVVREGSRESYDAAATIVSGLYPNLVPPELAGNYRRFINKTFGPKARALGLRPAATDSDETRLLRPRLVSLLAEEGEDPTIQQQALPLTLKWLEDHSALEGDMVDVILGAAARHGDARLFERFWAAAQKTTDRAERRHLLGAMSSFLDPAIIKKRNQLILTDALDAREAMWGALDSSVLEDPAAHEAIYAFVKSHYEVLLEKLPEEYGAYLVRVGSGFCDQAHRKDVEAFFHVRMSKSIGGPRMLSSVLEGISLCSASKTTQEASVAAFLRKY